MVRSQDLLLLGKWSHMKTLSAKGEMEKDSEAYAALLRWRAKLR
jgi:hypothetical protein